jgi:hypothetical protein
MSIVGTAGDGYGRVVCEQPMSWFGSFDGGVGIPTARRAALVGVLGMLGVVALSRCNRESSGGAGEPAAMGQVGERQGDPVEATPAALKPQGAGDKSSPASAGARVAHANFSLAIQSTGAYQVGKQAAVKIVLDAKGVYKVNDEYPYKFKLQPSAGLAYERDIVKRDAVKLEKKRATMTVGLTPKAAGKQRVAGKFYFSICTDEKCLIEKRDLALEVEVK